jgi:hypothetical protein
MAPVISGFQEITYSKENEAQHMAHRKTEHQPLLTLRYIVYAVHVCGIYLQHMHDVLIALKRMHSLIACSTTSIQRFILRKHYSY